MWGSKIQSAVISEFFQGNNILSQLENSYFGKIKETYESVFSKGSIDDFALPKVIVIGTESSGKSSLLERITKCQLFPRDSKLCTKCPIKVKLSNGDPEYKISFPSGLIQFIDNKNEIYNIIQKYMLELPKDHISSEEIEISIKDTHMPVFEFYDLPGIRSYPTETAQMSIKICKKYLADKNSIILCVVPCTTTRLTSCQSIALIKEMEREDNTILALTMADRLQPENIEELLINRIINNSCDELNGLNFYNYIAIINRIHLDCYSLDQHDSKEKQWFDNNIYSCIPPEFMQYSTIIQERSTLPMLLLNMDDLYKKFIKNDWAPLMIERMIKRENNIVLSVNNLGQIIDNSNIEHAISRLCDIIDLDVSTKHITGLFNDRSAIEFDSENLKKEGFNDDIIDELFDNIVITHKIPRSKRILDGRINRFGILETKIKEILNDFSKSFQNKRDFYKNNFKNRLLTYNCDSNDDFNVELYLANLMRIMISEYRNKFNEILKQSLTSTDFIESDKYIKQRIIYESDLIDVQNGIKNIKLIQNA